MLTDASNIIRRPATKWCISGTWFQITLGKAKIKSSFCLDVMRVWLHQGLGISPSKKKKKFQKDAKRKQKTKHFKWNDVSIYFAMLWYYFDYT